MMKSVVFYFGISSLISDIHVFTFLFKIDDAKLYTVMPVIHVNPKSENISQEIGSMCCSNLAPVMYIR